MRVVTYARCSTKSQEDRGNSLQDQGARFDRWLEASGHTRVKAYAESRSGGDVTHRLQFMQMMEEVPLLNVDAVVIDSLDRFSRDKFLGVEMLNRLSSARVKLWELERDEQTPLDMTVEADRDYAWQKFQDAEAERRRIRARQLKRYREQRRRNSTTTNRPAFGLKLVGEQRGNKQVVAHELDAELVKQVDERILAGWSQRKVLDWIKTVNAAAWKSRRGLSLALYDDDNAYVNAGVRTPEVQAQLRQLKNERLTKYGDKRITRKYQHEFSGLLACHRCVDVGTAPEQARMYGRYIVANEPNPFALVCDRKEVHDSVFFVQVSKVLPPLTDYFELLADRSIAEAVLRKWVAEPEPEVAAIRRRTLEQILGDTDAEEGAIDARSNAAITLMQNGSAGVASEATRILERASADRAALQARRDALRRQLSDLPTSAVRRTQGDRLLDLQREATEWDRYTCRIDEDGTPVVGVWREYLGKWVAALGPPVVYRKGAAGKVTLRWPYLDAARRATKRQIV